MSMPEMENRIINGRFQLAAKLDLRLGGLSEECWRGYDLLRSDFVTVAIIPRQASTPGRQYLENILETCAENQYVGLPQIMAWGPIRDDGKNRLFAVLPDVRGVSLQKAMQQAEKGEQSGQDEESPRTMTLHDCLDVVQQLCFCLEYARRIQLPLPNIDPQMIWLTQSITAAGHEHSNHAGSRVNVLCLGIPAPGDNVKSPQETVPELGKLLYRLVTGKTPDAPPRAPRIDHPEEVSEKLERIMLAAIASAKGQHYEGPQALAQDLAEELAKAHDRQSVGSVRTPLSQWPKDQLGKPGDASRDASSREDGHIRVKLEEIRLQPGGKPEAVPFFLHFESPRTDSVWIDISGEGGKFCTPVPRYSRENPLTKDFRSKEEESISLFIAPPANEPAGRYKVVLTLHSLKAERNSSSGQSRIDQTSLNLHINRNDQMIISELWPEQIRSGSVANIRLENRGNAEDAIDIVPSGVDRHIDFGAPRVTALLKPDSTMTVGLAPRVNRLHVLGRDQVYGFAVNATPHHDKNGRTLKGSVQETKLLPYWALFATVFLVALTALGGLALAKPRIGEDTLLSDMACEQAIQSAGITQIDGKVVCVKADTIQGRSAFVRVYDHHSGTTYQIPLDRQTQVPLDTIGPFSITEVQADNAVASTESSLPVSPQRFFLLQSTDPDIPISNLSRAELVVAMGNRAALAPKWLLPISTSRRAAVLFAPAVPTPIPPALALTEFCIENADDSTQRVCSHDIRIAAKLPVPTDTVDKLHLSWTVSAAEGTDYRVAVEPKSVEVEEGAHGVTISLPKDSTTYTARLYDADGVERSVLQVQAEIPSVQCFVTATSGAYLRESPGTNFPAISPEDSPLPAWTPLDVLSKPTDYAINDDPFFWTRVRVVESGEMGWIVRDLYWCIGEDPLTPTAVAALVPAPSARATAIAAEVKAAGINAQLNGAESTSTGVQSPSGSANGNGNAAAIANSPVDNLPIAAPTFGPTSTPVPTPTNAPTPTTTPSPRVQIQLDRTVIRPGECVQATWTIVNVAAVYYDFGDGEVPSNQNENYTQQKCFDNKGDKHLRWRIIDRNGHSWTETRAVTVQASGIEVVFAPKVEIAVNPNKVHENLKPNTDQVRIDWDITNVLGVEFERSDKPGKETHIGNWNDVGRTIPISQTTWFTWTITLINGSEKTETRTVYACPDEVFEDGCPP